MPRLRGSVPLDSAERERARLVACQDDDRSLPTRGVHGFDRRYEVSRTDAPFPVHVVRPRGRRPRSTVYYLHGGGYVAPADPLHTKYALRLATELDAEVVLPDYPLAPGHDWRASHQVLLDDLAARCATQDRGRRRRRLRGRRHRAGAGPGAARPRRAPARRSWCCSRRGST